MESDTFDDFLQDACMQLHEMWDAAGGNTLSDHELIILNGVLTQFFADKQEEDDEN